jgi:hypothetical protein
MQIEDNISGELIELVEEEANPTRGKPGRPPTTKRAREMTEKLRTGESETVDRSWLLEQLLLVYKAKDCRASEKIRALELMAKISGYEAEQDNDERKALHDLMKDMERDARSG